jgi:hypothetical protein
MEVAFNFPLFMKHTQEHGNRGGKKGGKKTSMLVDVKFNSCKIIPHYCKNRFALHMHTSTISSLIFNTLNPTIH